jgi:uncharacterized lipoprotein
MWVVGCLAILGLSGCKSWLHRKDDCLKHQPYEDAQSVPALHASQELAQPLAKQSLKIPDVTAQSGPKVQCLDQPPKFQEAVQPAKPAPNERFHTPVAEPKDPAKP